MRPAAIRRWCLLLACAALPGGLAAQTPEATALPAATFTVDFNDPGLIPAHWVLSFSETGAGHFRSERGAAPADALHGLEAPDFDRDAQVSPQFAAHVFAEARRHRLFHEQCESHMKVAFAGWKKFLYSGPDGAGDCTFNYSKDKDIQALGEDLQAVAATLLEGARLEALLQHDPLGLDREMEYLTEAAGDGRAQQLVSIRPILEKLAADDQVLERVRRRARALLVRAQG